MRRALLCAAAAVGLVGAAPAAKPTPTPATADGRSLVFEAMRGNTRIGTHSLRFTQRGTDLTVDVAIDFRARVLFVPFSYSLRNTEVWRENRLVSMDSRTRTNDKEQTATARLTPDGLRLTSTDGVVRTVPATTLTTTYWYSGTPQARQLINTQKGELLTGMTGTAPTAVRVPAVAGPLPAREFRLKDDRKFAVNLAYDAKGCLVGVNFKFPVTGDLITYRLVARPRADAAPDLAANPLLSPCLEPSSRTAQTVTGG
jgi:hypothetical protein